MSKIPTCTLRPLEDRVVIYTDDALKVSEGGIIIPDTAQERPAKGTVVAVGPGYTERPTKVKVGDRVVFGKMSGEPIEWDDTKFLMMRETDILSYI